jgi:hypothetical protein
VLPEIIIELADTPIERIEQAIAHGQAHPEAHDLAGWVVKLLRTARDYGWAIPQPWPASANSPAHAYQIDIDRYTSGAYGDLFRRGGDTSDLKPTAELQNHRTTEPGTVAPSPSLSMSGAASPLHPFTPSPAHSRSPISDPQRPHPAARTGRPPDMGWHHGRAGRSADRSG